MAGGAASHPLDVIKVRLQVQGEGALTGPRLNPFQMGRSIVSTDGFPGLFRGLTASLLRQGVYSRYARIPVEMKVCLLPSVVV